MGKVRFWKIVAGLDNEFEGEIIIDGEKIVKPSKKQGFIFQEHRLFPWLTVEENIAADLSLKDKYVKDKVKEWIEIVRLDGFEKILSERNFRRDVTTCCNCESLIKRSKCIIT